MADITLSKAVRANLLSLQNTAGLLGKTQERLATGLKVNSALDNATNFFTASALNARAGDLGRLLDSVNSATETLSAANNGVTAISQLIETAQATARQALQTSGRQTINDVKGRTDATYNPGALSVVSGDNISAPPAGTGTGALTPDAFATSTFTVGADRADAAVTIGGAAALADGDALTANGNIGNGDTLTIEIDNGAALNTITVNVGPNGVDTGTVTNTDGTTQSISISENSTFADLKAAINTAAGNLDANLAVDTSAGNLAITAADGNVASIRIAGTDADVVSELGLDTGTAIGGDASNQLITRNAAFDGLAADGDTLSISTGSASTYTNFGTITFGAGVSAPKSLAEFAAAINGLTPTVSATVSGNNIVTLHRQFRGLWHRPALQPGDGRKHADTVRPGGLRWRRCRRQW